MALHTDDMAEFDDETPQPIDADSVAQADFDRLQEGQGAVLATSARHARATEGSRAHAASSGGNKKARPLNRRTLAIVCAAAAVAIVVMVAIFVQVLSAPGPSAQSQVEVEQTAVAPDQSIVSRGVTYELAQANDGTYSLVEKREGAGQSVSLGNVAGTPVSLVLFDGALIIPENLPDGSWDVVAYTIGSGWSQLANKDGNPTTGTGSISAATLEGSNVVLTVDGSRVEVPLVW